MDISQLHKLFLECGGKLTTDSRKIEPGCIFVALKGENFDGNDFAQAALEQGAALCVVTAGSKATTEAHKTAGASKLIPVPDTLKTLQELAAYHREHTLHDGRRIPMLALTGTNGKTTTKELIRSVLATKYNLLATEGNFNNNLGVPFTLLRLTPQNELAVVEMGASHPGDINELVAIAHPDYGLITNVGRAHLLGFGSFEGVKATKGELYDYVASVGGKCFVNTALPDLVEMAAARKGMKTIDYGRAVQDVTILPQDAEHPFLRLLLVAGGKTYTVNTQLVGAYNADNVLSALAVGAEFGVDINAAIAAIEAYEPSNRRSQMVKLDSNTLILDAYNANPSSMSAALDNFSQFEAPKKAVMFGDMLELGAESVALHEKILKKIHDQVKPDLVLLVGGEFTAAAKNLGYAWTCFHTSDEAAQYVAAHPLEGYAVLVKGSRGTKMENIFKI